MCTVDGNISSLKYHEILAAHYIPNIKRWQILQQDGAPSNTSASTSKILEAKTVKMFQDWQAQLSEMNNIEHAWGKMKGKAWKMKPKEHEVWRGSFYKNLGMCYLQNLSLLKL